MDHPVIDWLHFNPLNCLHWGCSEVMELQPFLTFPQHVSSLIYLRPFLIHLLLFPLQFVHLSPDSPKWDQFQHDLILSFTWPLTISFWRSPSERQVSLEQWSAQRDQLLSHGRWSLLRRSRSCAFSECKWRGGDKRGRPLSKNALYNQKWIYQYCLVMDGCDYVLLTHSGCDGRCWFEGFGGRYFT